jgi:hypothetical protein
MMRSISLLPCDSTVNIALLGDNRWRESWIRDRPARPGAGAGDAAHSLRSRDDNATIRPRWTAVQISVDNGGYLVGLGRELVAGGLRICHVRVTEML